MKFDVSNANHQVLSPILGDRFHVRLGEPPWRDRIMAAIDELPPDECYPYKIAEHLECKFQNIQSALKGMIRRGELKAHRRIVNGRCRKLLSRPKEDTNAG